MKAQDTTKNLSSFLVSCMFIASAAGTVIGINLENTSFILIGIAAMFMSFCIEFLLISLEESKISNQKKTNHFSAQSGANVSISKTKGETIHLGFLNDNNAA